MKQLRQRSGQMAVEMILMLALFLGASYFVRDAFQSNGIIAQIVSRPWLSIAGMLQNGVWAPPEESNSQHPNNFSRVRSPFPEAAK